MPAIPMPAASNFLKNFAHPLNPQDFGVPIACVNHYPLQDRGQRRQWRYVIAYAKRSEHHSFTLRCPSLPLELSRQECVAAVIRSTRQPLRQEFLKNLAARRDSYVEVLLSRRDDKYIPEVEEFFESLMQLTDSNCHESYYDALAHLSKEYGNEVYVPPLVHITGLVAYCLRYLCNSCHSNISHCLINNHHHYYCYEGLSATRRPDYYVDPISWGKARGCEVDHEERRQVNISYNTYNAYVYWCINFILICYHIASAERWHGRTKEEKAQDKAFY